MAKDTKKRVFDAALILFARNGYEATSMVEIADAVGIKAPSLYAHFKNKQALFDAMVEAMREYFWQSYPALHTPTENEAEEAKLVAENPFILMDLSIRTFHFYFGDKHAGTFRRLLSIERYKNKQMDEVYRELYIDAPIENQTELFSALIEQGAMLGDIDPRTAALEAFSPFLFLISKYDCMPDKEDKAIEELKAHIAQFLSKYMKK